MANKKEREIKDFHPSLVRHLNEMQDKLDTRIARYPDINGDDNWKSLGFDNLLRHLDSEVVEFKAEIKKIVMLLKAHSGNIPEYLLKAALIESADVSNIAMMIGDILIKECRGNVIK